MNPYKYESESNNGWRQICKTTIASHYREGWKGVYDSLKSAITKDSRYTITKAVTFGVWVKSEHEVDVKLHGAQLVVGAKEDQSSANLDVYNSVSFVDGDKGTMIMDSKIVKWLIKNKAQDYFDELSKGKL